MSKLTSRDELATLLRKTYPDAKPKKLTNWESQIWPFAHVMAVGDLVVMPLKSRPAIEIGVVNGPYAYRPDWPEGSQHTRSIDWIAEVPKNKFGQDLLYSFGAFMTVCRIRRNNALERVSKILHGQPDDGAAVETDDHLESSDLSIPPDLEQIASDQIREYIAENFAGHGLAKLVGELLKAQGYQVRVSPEGPDGGVDIIAGRGPLGFDAPAPGRASKVRRDSGRREDRSRTPRRH